MSEEHQERPKESILETARRIIGLGPICDSCLGRQFAMGVSFVMLCIGFVMAGFTARKQALHDMIAGTLVVNRDVYGEDIIRSVPVESRRRGLVIKG